MTEQVNGTSGAIAAAAHKIAGALDNLADANRQRFPEAPASITAKVYDPNGFDCLVTVRGETMAKLAEQWKKFSAYMLSNGFEPQGNRRQMAPPPPPPEPTAGEIEAQLNPDMAKASQPPADGLWFEAETLIANVNNGKTYWKVQGGQFSKFGVTIWPEVIQAAVKSGVLWDIEGDLDPMQTYPINGVIAHYELNDKGKPNKVTALQRAT